MAATRRASGACAGNCASVTELKRWVSLTELEPEALMLAA
jgi:hypothetical protein